MVALIILLSVVAVSILMVRITKQALVLTGLSEEVAHFQARSVFTGTGFTTGESESVMEHPLRRKIIKTAMLLQNAGLVTVISTFVLSFIDTGSSMEMLRRGGLLVGGLLLLAYLANNKWMKEALERAIEWGLNRFTGLTVKDYHTLLNLQEGYAVTRFRVKDGSWLDGKTLEEMDLPSEGVMVLTVGKGEEMEGAPKGQHRIEAGEWLTVYGHEDGVAELMERRPDEADGDSRQQAEEQHATQGNPTTLNEKAG